MSTVTIEEAQARLSELIHHLRNRERFVAALTRDRFDYTEWRKTACRIWASKR